MQHVWLSWRLILMLTGIDPVEQYVTVTLSADYKTAGLVAGLITKITEELGKIESTNNSVKLDTEWARPLSLSEPTRRAAMPQSQFRSRTSLTTNKRIISPFFPGEHPPSGAFFVSNRLAYLLKNNWKI